MKAQNIVLWFSLILLVMLVSSCVQPIESLITPSPEISILPSGSVTPAPSFTPLPTDSPTSTPTPIIIPTLPVEEARTRLLDLLANNGNCRLPCLWGIAPGKSSFQDAQIILAPLSGLSNSVYLNPPGPGDIMPRYTEGDLEIYTRVAFLTNPDNDIVNRILFNAEVHRPIKEGGYEDVFDSKFFGGNVSAYMLPHVLSEHGVPFAVLISTFATTPTRGSKDGFYMLLLYPDQGILAHYTTQWRRVGNNILGCLSNAHVEMELFPPGNGDSFFKLLAPTEWANIWPATINDSYKPLEDVTSMLLEQFYETFREPTDKCIETPAMLWPMPEP